jgi:hypothetical protein
MTTRNSLARCKEHSQACLILKDQRRDVRKANLIRCLELETVLVELERELTMSSGIGILVCVYTGADRESLPTYSNGAPMAGIWQTDCAPEQNKVTATS